MKKLLIVLLMFITVSGLENVLAMSIPNAGAINSQNVMDLRLHEQVTRARKETKTMKKEDEETKRKKLDEINQAAVTDIKYISFINNKFIASRDLFKVVQCYVNKPMSIQNISAIRKEVMKYYQNRGYYSVIVLVNSENTQTGELVLDINEGGKNSITVQD